MVTAILAGRKTQTRRLVKTNDGQLVSGAFWDHRGWRPIIRDGVVCWLLAEDADDAQANGFGPSPKPYAQIGDRLWVRETWCTEKRHDRRKPSRVPEGARIWYLADGKKPKWAGRGRPSIFMLPWMSRIELEVERVRVERVDEISEEDAKLEGVSLDVGCACETDVEEPGPHKKLCRWSRADWPGEHPLGGIVDPNRMAFAALWDAINGKRAPFSDHPWVWAVDFRIFSARGAR